jgi:hypothetical protein
VLREEEPTLIEVAIIDGDFVSRVVVFLAAEGLGGVALEEGVRGGGTLGDAEAFGLHGGRCTVSVGEVKYR